MKTARIFIYLLVACLLFTSSGVQIVRAADNPSLYYTQADLDTFKALRNAPSHQALWNTISTWADTHIDDACPSDFDGLDWNTQCGIADDIIIFIETMSFMYHMTDDTDYADAAVTWLKGIVTWKSWRNTANDFTLSRMLVAAAVGYYDLGDYMSAGNKAALLNKIVAEGTYLYDRRSYYDFSRDYPNYKARVAGAMGMAGLAIGDDDPVGSDWRSFAATHTERSLDTMGADGASFEGTHYAIGMLEHLVPYIHALKVSGGTDYFDIYRDFLSNYGYFAIWTVDYNGYRVQLEDTAGGLTIFDKTDMALCFLYKFAAEYSDSYIEWYAEHKSQNRFVRDYIWKSPSLSATDISGLPLFKHFDSMGYVFWRSGWTDNDLFVIFKSGTSRGHAHPDQNSFAIWNNGSMLTGGSGYACSYDEYDETWAHNCIIVDPIERTIGWSGGQAQEPGDMETVPLGTKGVMQEHTSNDYYSYARGFVDSSLYTNYTTGEHHLGTYPTGDLDSWTRQIALVRNPFYLVIYDDVQASEAKQFDWCFNGKDLFKDGQSIAMDEVSNVLTFTVGTQMVETKILEPTSYSYLTELAQVSGPDYYRAHVHPASNTDHAYFLNAIFPDESLKVADVEITHVNQGNCVGAIVTYDDKKDLILFSRDGSPVDEYIDLDGTFEAIDGGDYLLSFTKVRVQFDRYQVLRLRKSSEVSIPATTEVSTSAATSVLTVVRRAVRWIEEVIRLGAASG